MKKVVNIKFCSCHKLDNKIKKKESCTKYEHKVSRWNILRYERLCRRELKGN